MPVSVNYSFVLAKNEFTANSYTTNAEILPDVTGLANGGFVTAYVSAGSTLLDFYDANFNRIGDYKIPYRGGTLNTGGVAVTQLRNGNVVVTWDDEDNGVDPGIRAQIFTSAGVAVGSELLLFGEDRGFEDPSIAALIGGGFAVSCTLDDNVYVSMYDAAGTFVPPGTLVNNNAIDGPQKHSEIAALKDGGFVVVYDDLDPSDHTVRAKIYNANGSVRRDDFLLAGYGDNTECSVAALKNGGFVVVYTDSEWGEDGVLGNGISMQLHDANGVNTPAGVVRVNVASSTDEVQPDVAVMANGYIVVTWSRPMGSHKYDIYCKVYDEAGRPVGQFTTPANGPADTSASSVAAMLDGEFTVAWQDSTGNDIHQKVYNFIRRSAGTVGNDTIAGDALDDWTLGNAGNDVLTGFGGQDRLSGEGGNDRITGDAGHDGLYGGTENDRLDGGAGNDTVIGEAGNDSLSGGFANDSVFGGEGNDTLAGADGADTLIGGVGLDTMAGGFGNDQYSVDAIGDRLNEINNGGLDKVVSTIAYSLVGQFIEILELRGTAAINGTGNALINAIIGNSAANTLLGQGGADALHAGGGPDSLSGGEDGDLLDGGAGADTLTGGNGSDRFLYSGGAVVDRITDFQDDDTFLLPRSTFPEFAQGALPAARFKNIALAAVDADDRILYDGNNGALLYDSDGSGPTGTSLIAMFDNVPVLTAEEFFVI